MREALKRHLPGKPRPATNASYCYEAEDSLKSSRRIIKATRRPRRAKLGPQPSSGRRPPGKRRIVAEFARKRRPTPRFAAHGPRFREHPAPEEFGFRTVENNADKANGRAYLRNKQASGYMRPYTENYYGSRISTPART